MDYVDENWRIGEGESSGGVISDTPNRHSDPRNIAFYGGHLIAESIPTRSHARLIAAAPDLLRALQNIHNDDGRIPDTIWTMRAEAIKKAIG